MSWGVLLGGSYFTVLAVELLLFARLARSFAVALLLSLSALFAGLWKHDR